MYLSPPTAVDGELARRACTTAIVQLTGGRGSTLPTTNRDAGVMIHPQVSDILLWKANPDPLPDILNLRFFRNEIDRIPSTLATVTKANLMDLVVRISYQAQVEDFMRARTELSGIEQEIHTRIIMLKPRLRRQFWEQHGEYVNGALGFF